MNCQTLLVKLALKGRKKNQEILKPELDVGSREQYINLLNPKKRKYKWYISSYSLLDNENWIGLENMHTLTNQPSTPMKLRIVMEDFSGTVKEAYYNDFRIEDKVNKHY